MVWSLNKVVYADVENKTFIPEQSKQSVSQHYAVVLNV